LARQWRRFSSFAAQVARDIKMPVRPWEFGQPQEHVVKLFLVSVSLKALCLRHLGWGMDVDQLKWIA
jgi:hypothetical protein